MLDFIHKMRLNLSCFKNYFHSKILYIFLDKSISWVILLNLLILHFKQIVFYITKGKEIYHLHKNKKKSCLWQITCYSNLHLSCNTNWKKKTKSWEMFRARNKMMWKKINVYKHVCSTWGGDFMLALHAKGPKLDPKWCNKTGHLTLLKKDKNRNELNLASYSIV